jgi:replicative superfamily II helicase
LIVAKGLSFDDRATVEAFFLQGHLKILCATSTLAHGVNLPAHLVVIKGLDPNLLLLCEDVSNMNL